MNRAGGILWRLRYEFPAILAVAAVMAVAVDHVELQSFSGVVPFLGTVVAIFIGFRNRNAYNRWWEARTLWSGVVINARSLSCALNAYEDGTPEMAAITDRMRRREVRHAWRLAAELHDRASAPELADLTAEDPPDSTATELLSRQAADVGELSRAGMIDRQARRVLVGVNTAQVNTAAGLERIKSQPVPRFYALFTRTLAWFFAVVVCTGLGGGGHDDATGFAVGVLIMALVVVAERLGGVLEEPMSDDDVGLPLDRFCATLTADLLGPANPPARS